MTRQPSVLCANGHHRACPSCPGCPCHPGGPTLRVTVLVTACVGAVALLVGIAWASR